MYKGKFPDLFKKITQRPSGKIVRIFEGSADTAINEHIHDINAGFEKRTHSDHTSIPIKYRQHEDLACGFYSLASDLHHV